MSVGARQMANGKWQMANGCGILESMGKTVFRIGINTLIGLVLVYFWLKLVNIEEIFHALESFNPIVLVPAILLMILGTIVRAVRFKILLLKSVSITYSKMINLSFLSQLLSFTVPIRLGELTKGVYLSTQYNLHFGKAVIWVFLDRFLDFWAVLVLSLLFLSIIPTRLPEELRGYLFFGAGIISLAIIVIVLKPDLFRLLAKKLSVLLVMDSVRKKFLEFAFFMIECFSLLKGSYRRNGLLLALTVFSTFTEGMAWYLILSSFILDLSIIKVWLGSMLNSLTFLIPAAPGYVGSAEAAGLAVFTYGLGYDKVYVSASTIVFHALSLLYILSSGIYGLYTLKFNLRLVWKKLLRKD